MKARTTKKVGGVFLFTHLMISSSAFRHRISRFCLFIKQKRTKEVHS